MKDIWIRYKNDSSKSLIYAGFFLNYADMEELEEEVWGFLKEDVGKKYWNYSCSLEDDIKYDRRVRKKDRYVPKFDEILFLGAIPPQNIERIGQWDHGIFTPHDSFEKYVKEEYKQNYMKILKLV